MDAKTLFALLQLWRRLGVSAGPDCHSKYSAQDDWSHGNLIRYRNIRIRQIEGDRPPTRGQSEFSVPISSSSGASEAGLLCGQISRRRSGAGLIKTQWGRDQLDELLTTNSSPFAFCVSRFPSYVG